MNIEPGEYNNLNTWAFSVSWTDTPNANGVKPPNPQFQPSAPISYILPQTIVADSTQNGKAPVGLIQSKREPYAVEWYPGVYGSLNSRLGTGLGT